MVSPWGEPSIPYIVDWYVAPFSDNSCELRILPTECFVDANHDAFFIAHHLCYAEWVITRTYRQHTRMEMTSASSSALEWTSNSGRFNSFQWAHSSAFECIRLRTNTNHPKLLVTRHLHLGILFNIHPRHVKYLVVWKLTCSLLGLILILTHGSHQHIFIRKFTVGKINKHCEHCNLNWIWSIKLESRAAKINNLEYVWIITTY